jgi:hypothetical protein
MSGEISSCRDAKYDIAYAKCQVPTDSIRETIFTIYYNWLLAKKPSSSAFRAAQLLACNAMAP